MVSTPPPSSLFWTALRASTVRRKRLPVATRGWTAAPLRPRGIQEEMASHSLHWRGLLATQTSWGLCPSWRRVVVGLVPTLTPAGSVHRNRHRLTLSTVGSLPELNGGEFARALTDVINGCVGHGFGVS
ncbi:MAG: hypothetical protein ACJA00_005763 [Myxococcota bacterium]|jgi:hypothetical protein